MTAPSTQRKVPRGRDDEQRLTANITELARQPNDPSTRRFRKTRASSYPFLADAIQFDHVEDVEEYALIVMANDLRHDPLERRKATPEKMLAKA
jgi:hypothetical protein